MKAVVTGCSKSEGIIRKTVKTTKIWNVYEALEGHYIAGFNDEPRPEEVKIEVFLQPRVKEAKIKNEIFKTFEKLTSVTRRSSIERYRAELRSLGIPTPLSGVSVDKVMEIFYPFYVAYLRKGKGERMLAVDGVVGGVHKTVSRVLTNNLSYVLEAVKEIQR